MSRSSLSSETLKLIQKQGLSISIIGGEDSKTSSRETGSKEVKSKQNAVALENLPNISRSMADTKPTVSYARNTSNVSVDARTSNISSSLSTSPAGQPVILTKSNSPDSTTPEITSQNSQKVNNASVVANRIGQIDKNQSNVRLSQSLSENKLLNSRNIQNISHSEVKLPNRSTPSDTKIQVVYKPQTSSAESKTNANQNRLSATSPPLDVKNPGNQARLIQSTLTPTIDKKINVQRKQLHMVEIKTPNSQCKVIPVKQSDIISQNLAKGLQNVKYLAASRVISQQNPVRTSLNSNDCKQAINKSSSNALSERSLNNPFRLASTLTKKNLEEKAIKTKSAPNVGILENQSAQTKVTQHILKSSDNKAVNQVIKISEISQLHQKPLSSESLSDLPSSPLNTMPVNKGTIKRVAIHTSTPIGKRRCVKLASPTTSEQSGSQSDINTLSSDESPVKEKKVFNLKTLTPGLTITPVNSSAATASTSTSSKVVAEPSQNLIVICPSCKQCSFNLTTCDSCHKEFTTKPVRYQFRNTPSDSASIVVTQNVTTSIEKSMQIVYHLPGGPSQNQSFQFQQSKQVIKVSPRRGRPKRRFAEPVCYTLSSDEEEALPYGYQLEADGRNSEHSGASDPMQDENTDFDEPQFPGVTSINSKLPLNSSIEDEEEEELEEEEEDLEQGMESEEELMDEEELEGNHDFEGAEEEEIDEEEDEEIPPDEENSMLMYNKLQRSMQGSSLVVTCRSIRIGSFKIHPEQQHSNISVTFTEKGISFLAPLVTDGKTCVQLNLKACDTTKMMIHFGKCLPIIFAYTTKNFGEFVRRTLNMTKANANLFDPTSEDVKKDKLTFLIDTLTDEQRAYLRQIYPGPEKLREIDQKEANEILVVSTPQHVVKIDSLISSTSATPSSPALSASGIIPTNLSTPQSLSITKVIVKPAPPVPVTKMLTYPPPPQTGGIAINTADFATLEEGEFLNDAILDFYLKYVFYEKLSSHDREKTHIFSSFFYPRLTQKPDRPRPGDNLKTMQMRRHSQVRTWTKHVDIFSKDTIVIPVNQHNHWFLAFICYPGRVPDAPIVTEDPKENEHSSNNQTNKVIIKEEISNNEDLSMQDENSANSNTFYEVEEPPDSDEENSPELPDKNTQTNNNVIYFDSNNQRRETPCILVLDSLSGPSRWRIAATLREYLEMEWKIRKGTNKIFDKNTMQGYMLKCPQQTNFSDCGLYVLQYVESFFENPIPYFGHPMPDLTNWFSDAKISKKRQQIKELILNLQKKFMTKQTNTSIKKINLSSISPSISVSTVDNR